MAVGSGGPGRRFQKGQSGNPKGRPKKGDSFTDILTAMASVKDVRTQDGKVLDRKTALCEMMWANTLREKDTYAAKFLIERMEGKVPLPLQGPPDEDGNPTPVAIIQTVERLSLDDWRKLYSEHTNTSGSPSPAKPKPSRAQPTSSSSEEPREEGKATSSSGTISRITKNGEKRGKASSSGGRTKSSTRS